MLRNLFKKYLKVVAQVGRSEIYLDETLGDEEDDKTIGDVKLRDKRSSPEKDVYRSEVRHKLVEPILEVLSDSEREVLLRRCGFDDEPETLESIGSSRGVTRERIRMIEKETIRKVKGYVFRKGMEKEVWMAINAGL